MKTFQKTPADWQEAAGLSEKPRLKLLDNIAKHVPTPSEIGVGLVFIFIGMTAWTGGAIGVRGTVDADPTWVTLEHFPKWVCVLVIWLGIDALFCKGRVTPWLLTKYVQPAVEAVLKATVGEERLERLRKRLDKDRDKNKEKEKEDQKQ